MMCKNKIFICLLLLSVVFAFSCKNEPETKKYNVSFYDGNSVLFHQTVESGKKVARPINPTKDGFIFDNWYQDTSFTQIYDFNSPVNSDKALYAKWNTTPTPVSEKYSVTYNANGASSGTAPLDSNSPYTSGSTVTVLGKGNLVYTLKSFAGWNTASDGSGTDYVTGQTFVITCNTVLYAKWSEKNPSPSAPVIPISNIRCATSETSNDASISDVDGTMEYSTDGGTTWIPVTGTQITGLSAGIVKVRVKETDTTLAGEITDVDLRCENTSVPSDFAYVAPTTIGGSDGKITGVSTAMEYSTDGGTTWIACTGTEITGLSAGDVQIRYVATDKKKASTPTTVTVEDKVTISFTFDGDEATGSMDPVFVQKGTSYTLPASTFTAPTGKSFSKWKVQGSGAEYSVGESFTVSSDITLVAQWSDKASGPEAPTGITRSVSPSNTSTADGVISGVNTTMQYSTDNGANWNDCTGTTITGLKAGKVQIRVKETETTLAGNILEFYLKVESSKISAPTGLTPTAPTTAGGSDGKITGVSTAMEYSTDDGEHWNPCGTEITGLSAGTVKVRLKETDITEAGQITEVVVKARYSISFAAGEHGSSTMSDASAVAGDSYTVPACGFTANTGYAFDTWNDGTNDVAVGSSITVNGNITLTAKWKRVLPDGALTGKFTVNADGKQICFSKGNLIAEGSSPSTMSGNNRLTWYFAENQYDSIGDDNFHTSGSLNSKIDLFCWSGTESANSAKWGVTRSTDDRDYAGDFRDWGKVFGEDSTWYTPSRYDWDYIIASRSTSTLNGVENARFVKAKVNNICGLILFPDEYVHPDGITIPNNINDRTAAYSGNSFSKTEWDSMETNGCVFLPVTGRRYTRVTGNQMSDAKVGGYYWYIKENHRDDRGDCDTFHIGEDGIDFSGFSGSGTGAAVRLITDAE